MKTQFDHSLISSFYLWFDDRLTREAEAVLSGKHQIFVHANADSTPEGFNSFFCPARQFSANDRGAPSGIFVNGTGITQNITGSPAMLINNDEGSVLLDESFGTSVTVSGNFLEKEINVYITNEMQEDIILSRDFVEAETSKTYIESTNQNGRRRFVAPAVFITQDRSKNKPFALGGVEDAQYSIKAIVVVTNNYELDGVMSLFKDAAHKSFKVIDYSTYPYGSFWHVKNPPYFYPDLVASQTDKSNYAYIMDVDAYRIKERLLTKLSKSVLFGFLDFKISYIRTTPNTCNYSSSGSSASSSSSSSSQSSVSSSSRSSSSHSSISSLSSSSSGSSGSSGSSLSSSSESASSSGSSRSSGSSQSGSVCHTLYVEDYDNPARNGAFDYQGYDETYGYTWYSPIVGGGAWVWGNTNDWHTANLLGDNYKNSTVADVIGDWGVGIIVSCNG